MLSGPGRRVGAWLEGYGRPPHGLSPLLTARYAVRRRLFWIKVGAVMGGLVPVWVIFVAVVTPGAGPFAVMVTGLYVIILGAHWYERRADRQLAATLQHRVARSAPSGLRALLGRWFWPTTVVHYGAGAALGVAAVAATSGTADRSLAIAFLAGLGLFAVLSTVVLNGTAGRPAIAEDERSLAYDEAVRRHDILLGLGPYPPLLAFIAAANSTIGPLTFAYLGYGIAALACWLAWNAEVHRMHADTAARMELQP